MVIQGLYDIMTSASVQQEINAVFLDKDIAEEYYNTLPHLHTGEEYILFEMPVSGKGLLEKVLKGVES